MCWEIHHKPQRPIGCEAFLFIESIQEPPRMRRLFGFLEVVRHISIFSDQETGDILCRDVRGLPRYDDLVPDELRIVGQLVVIFFEK